MPAPLITALLAVAGALGSFVIWAGVHAARQRLSPTEFVIGCAVATGVCIFVGWRIDAMSRPRR